MEFTITKRIKWHMAHRVPNHKSKCRSNHGHTYLLDALVAGRVVDQEGISDEGMVMDFGDVKDILMKNIYDVLDHGSMFWDQDPLVLALEADAATKLVKVPFIPTAENIARWCYDQVAPSILIPGQRWLRGIRVWETPNSVAEFAP